MFSESQEDWMPHCINSENTFFNEGKRKNSFRMYYGEIFILKNASGQQLDASMKYIDENGGIILYLRQGRTKYWDYQ